MFNKEELTQALRIHTLGYQFLMYIKENIDKKNFTFSRIHNGDDQVDVVFNWINDYYDYLPNTISALRCRFRFRIEFFKIEAKNAEIALAIASIFNEEIGKLYRKIIAILKQKWYKSILPAKHEIRALSNYFISYLSTSYELSEIPLRSDLGRDACYCDICLQLKNFTHLKSISPNKHDRNIAEIKRIEFVKEFATYYNFEIPEEKLNEIATDKTTLSDVACLTYTKTLFHRIATSEGGVYILALWRSFAWSPNGGVIQDYEYTVDEILAAAQRLKVTMIGGE